MAAVDSPLGIMLLIFAENRIGQMRNPGLWLLVVLSSTELTPSDLME